MGLLLKHLGYDVFYSNHTNAMWNIFYHKPELTIFPQVVAEKDKAQLAKKMGSKICVIHSEGTVSPHSERSFFEFDPTMKVEDYNDLKIVWGPEFKKLVIKNTDLSPDKIKICGNPRFDIYREPLSILLSQNTLSQKIPLDPNKKVILFASNFVNLDKNVKMLEKNYGPNYSEILEIERKLFEKTLNILKKYFSKNLDLQLVIKLHPLELGEKYEDLVSLKNVYMITNLDISLILNDIDLLLHTNSTVSSEASFLEKPVITLMFEEEYEEYIIENVKSLPKARDYNEFALLVEKCLSLGRMTEEITIKQEEFVAKWFYKIDGFSSIRCVKGIDEFIQNHQNSIRTTRRINLMDFFKILKGSTPGKKTISILSRIIHGGKLTYYQKIGRTERISQKDVKNMEDVINKVYSESCYYHYLE